MKYFRGDFCPGCDRVMVAYGSPRGEYTVGLGLGETERRFVEMLEWLRTEAAEGRYWTCEELWEGRAACTP